MVIPDETITFVGIDADGKPTEYEALFIIDDAGTGYNYLVYTDHTVDEGGDVAVYASSYDPDTVDERGDGFLQYVPSLPQTEEEWAIIEQALDEYNQRMLEQEDR